MTSAEYAALSRRYVRDSDLRMAQLAAWAGDVHVLEDLLWRNGLAQAPDPAAELAAIGESVAASVEDLAAELPAGPVAARSLVEAAREAMVATFDPSVHELLTDRFADLSALDECTQAAGQPVSPTTPRMDGRPAVVLAAELRAAAGDCATMADLLTAAGESEAAGRLARQAETAAFEAYLVAAATRAGDHALATVDLRWDLVADDESEPSPGPRRERFAGVVGSAERAELLAGFEPLETP